MKLSVLISTYNERIEKVAEMLLPFRPDVHYIISHQYTDYKYVKEYPGLNRSDVSIYPIFGKGLSKNRNNGLQHASGDIALIADDDIKYFDDSFDIVIDSFQHNPDVDIALFKIRTLEGEPEYKAYPLKPYLFNGEKKHWVSSIEIAFRLDTVKEKGVSFDERFGLGNKYIIGGEEHVFVHDCIKRGLQTMFIPKYVVRHPYESSVKKNDKLSVERLITQGAIDARTKGGKAILINIKRFLLSLIKLNFGSKPFKSLFFKLVGVFFILLRF